MTPNSHREGGVFTEGRWRKRSIAEILALNAHIKRHPGVGPPETPRKSTEQGNSYYVGNVCFVDRLPGLLTIHDRPGISTMQEESSSLMIAPLSDGNAHGMSSSTEEAVRTCLFHRQLGDEASSPLVKPFRVEHCSATQPPKTRTPVT